MIQMRMKIQRQLKRIGKMKRIEMNFSIINKDDLIVVDVIESVIKRVRTVPNVQQ